MPHNESAKTGVILVNLGTPEAPTPEKVGSYLKEFLMDPFVIDIPFPIRWFLVNVLIVPKRSVASAELYKKVWTASGSPLLVNTIALSAKVQQQLGDKFLVRPAMRYGQPSIASAVQDLKAAGVTSVVTFPLYPQYSLAATKSSQVAIERAIREKGGFQKTKPMPPFYDDPRYLDAVAEVSAPALNARPYDMALFSFHGLPERQIKKTDKTKRHCFSNESCCDKITAANQDCYRAQSYATAHGVAQRLGIPKEKYLVAFQSRLEGSPWIKPFSDEYYRTLPARGVKRLAVLCPSFVADCLETLEEVSIRGKEEFIQNGGEDLFLIPSLNDSEVWARAVSQMVAADL